jgi:hypothetical protein
VFPVTACQDLLMQTRTNIDRRRRRQLRLGAAVLVVAVAVAVAIGLRGWTGEAGPAVGGDPAAAVDRDLPLPEQLADWVVAYLEDASLDEHAAHGHHFDEESHGVVCAADTLGFAPADAATLEEVEVIYAHHMCAEYGPGLVWPEALRASGPLALHLTVDPPNVLLPEQVLRGQDGVTHADRVREILPEEYHEQVLAAEGFDPAVAEELRERFEAVSR